MLNTLMVTAKISILVALLNSVVLLVSIGIIVYEAVQRMFHPAPVPGLMLSVIAGIDVIINFTSAKLFFKNKDHDINVKSAYLHLMSDAVSFFRNCCGWHIDILFKMVLA